jgi:hypothetical protein
MPRNISEFLMLVEKKALLRPEFLPPTWKNGMVDVGLAGYRTSDTPISGP